MKTKVIFRIVPANYAEAEPTVIALFPELPVTRNPNECLSYSRYGQHGAAMASGHGWRLATPAEYADLKHHLETYLGAESYQLDVKTRSCPAYRRARINALQS